MNVKTQHLIKLIESWEKAYLPASATMVLTESKKMIESLCQEVDLLTNLVEEQRNQIDNLSKSIEPKAMGGKRKASKNEN